MRCAHACATASRGFSAAHAAVTNARASDDYGVGSAASWHIARSSLPPDVQQRLLAPRCSGLQVAQRALLQPLTPFAVESLAEFSNRLALGVRWV